MDNNHFIGVVDRKEIESGSKTPGYRIRRVFGEDRVPTDHLIFIPATRNGQIGGIVSESETYVPGTMLLIHKNGNSYHIIRTVGRTAGSRTDGAAAKNSDYAGEASDGSQLPENTKPNPGPHQNRTGGDPTPPPLYNYPDLEYEESKTWPAAEIQPRTNKPLNNIKNPQRKPTTETPHRYYKNNHHKTPDIGTIAGADQNIKKILDGLKQVDPQGLSNIFPQFYDMMEKIRSATSMKGSPGNSSGVSGNDGGGQEPSEGQKELISDALTGALSILVKELGYTTVLTSFTLPLLTNFNDLLEDYKDIVKDSLLSLYISVILYGEKDIPISIIPEIVFGDNIPSNVATAVPDMYTQNYYTSENDPYPGYVEFEGPNDNDEPVYILRTDEYLPFTSLDEELYSTAEQGFAREVRPYIITISLTVDILNELLEKYCNEITDIADEKGSGKGSSSPTDLISMLGPVLGGAISGAKTNHLPNSFLDQTKMNKLLNNATKEQNELKNVYEKYAKKAMKLPNKSSSMVSKMNNTNYSLDEVAEDQLTHLSKLSGSPSSSVPDTVDKENFIIVAETAANAFESNNVFDFIKIIKEI